MEGSRNPSILPPIKKANPETSDTDNVKSVNMLVPNKEGPTSMSESSDIEHGRQFVENSSVDLYQNSSLEK